MTQFVLLGAGHLKHRAQPESPQENTMQNKLGRFYANRVWLEVGLTQPWRGIA